MRSAPERDAHAAHARHAEHARQVVVSSSARYAAYLHVQGFYLEDGTGVVVQAACQGEVQLQLVLQLQPLEGRQDELGLLHALHAHGAVGQDVPQAGQLLLVVALQQDDGLQAGDGLVADALFAQFGVHVVQPYFVELVDGHGDVYNLVRRIDDLGDASQNLPVVNLCADTYAEVGKHSVDDLHEFHLIEQRVAPHDVGIALVEFAVASLLRTVGPPHGLYLVAFEGKVSSSRCITT